MKLSHWKLVVIRYQIPMHDPWPGPDFGDGAAYM
jgi:hypothetical protein